MGCYAKVLILVQPELGFFIVRVNMYICLFLLIDDMNIYYIYITLNITFGQSYTKSFLKPRNMKKINEYLSYFTAEKWLLFFLCT